MDVNILPRIKIFTHAIKVMEFMLLDSKTRSSRGTPDCFLKTASSISVAGVFTESQNR